MSKEKQRVDSITEWQLDLKCFSVDPYNETIKGFMVIKYKPLSRVCCFAIYI